MPDKLLQKLADGFRELPLLEERMTLGRSAESDLFVEDRSVSRSHARFERVGGVWMVSDLHSRNGTRVNEIALEADKPFPIKDGDTVTCGTVRLDFLRDEAEKMVFAKQEFADTSITLTQAITFDEILAQAQLPSDLPRPALEAIAHARKAARVAGKLGRIVLASQSLTEIVEALVALVFEASTADRAALLLWDPHYEELITKLVRSRDRTSGEEPLRITRTLVDRAFQTRSVAILEPKVDTSQSVMSIGLHSAVAVPLWQGTEVTGVLYADSLRTVGAFDPLTIDLLSALASHAAVALEQARLQARVRQKERLVQWLSRYNPQGVVDRILSSDDSASQSLMRAEDADVTILFCDLAGFSAKTEGMAPMAVLTLINEHFSRMTEVVFAHGGTLDKYIGDCLMAVFGAPEIQPDHARKAAAAALALRECFRSVAAGSEDLGFRIGMNSGRVIAGDVGSAVRREWTVLGAPVNLASRMQGMAERNQILITESTRAMLPASFEVKSLGPRRPKGFSRDYEVFELLGAGGAVKE
jgi:adenylate cyclase